MKFLTSDKEIGQEFERLMLSYSDFYWAVAWAGIGFSAFDRLVKKQNQRKIKKIVISTQMFNTDPDFIRTFLKNNKKRYFPRNRKGVFHPKLYLFQNKGGGWEAVIGSANFTNAAFSLNTEAMLLITDKDPKAGQFYQKAMNLINEAWNSTGCFTLKDLNEYEKGYEKKRQRDKDENKHWNQFKKRTKVRRDSTQYGGMTWREFVKKVKSEKSHSFEMRLEVLAASKRIFKKHKSLIDMDLMARKKLIGTIPKSENDDELNWGYFGEVKQRGDYMHEIYNIKKYPEISKALDKIPSGGNVTREHYNAFAKLFVGAFKKRELTGGTRLLAMKRPDIFICFNNANKKKLCKDFGIPVSSVKDFDSYWDNIIERIRESEWFNAPKAKNKIESKIWEGRTAFLDALYFEYEE